MKKLLPQVALTLLLGLMAIQLSFSQCYELGPVAGSLTPVLKSTGGFCPTPAQSTGNCDCPAGYVAVGYEGFEGNSYGAMVLSQFRLRCKQLNSNGTLGATVLLTCINGTAAGNSLDGPVDAAAGQAMVGAQLRIGCAIDGLTGYSKPITEIFQQLPNATSNIMTMIGGGGGSPSPTQYVPNGNVIVGMQTYIDPGNNISAGVAWRYAPIIACAAVCNISGITVSNISACNNNGTPSTADDTFTANVTVNFTDRPATGTLNLSGDGTASIAVGSVDSTTHTFTGVTMSADGGAISLTAAFSAAATCTLTNSNAGTAPAACSITPPVPCSISNISIANISACNSNGTLANAADDTFTANVTVTFVSAPITGTLNLSGSGTAAAAVGVLGNGTYTFTGVTMPANGGQISLSASFSANTACALTNNNLGTAPASCSPNAPTIPTMSEWGLIIFALIIFSLAVVFGTQQQQVLSTGNAVASISTRRRLPFNKQLYFKVLPFVYLGFVTIFATAVMLFGYEMTSADVPGSLLAGGVIAYLIHFVIQSSNPND